MAASKSYFPRASYRFLSSDRDAPITSDSIFELDESDVWNNTIRSSSPDYRKPVPSSRDSHKKSTSAAKAKAKRGAEAGPMTGSLPVNIPDWSKILKDDYKDNRRRDSDDEDDCDDGGGGGYGGGGDRVPPHEFLARQLARTRIASFSVHEGVGRTLKGRDLSRVRNAIWEKTGFQD
ncbi:hypothetical protein RHGRI_036514 [Rhododendron griersonianum]|uniref:Senescence regulator n=1 Tax=Rhododendron griersonianum TaxID=479676 RepID=A0AAV6HTN5_9ERIC|nr:hypothetical protein RHGRI_036514 [Rhododendron griersonianum]